VRRWGFLCEAPPERTSAAQRERPEEKKGRVFPFPFPEILRPAMSTSSPSSTKDKENRTARNRPKKKSDAKEGSASKAFYFFVGTLILSILVLLGTLLFG
jgi:hypothetical protein